jgi:hypothetical protein
MGNGTGGGVINVPWIARLAGNKRRAGAEQSSRLANGGGGAFAEAIDPGRHDEVVS